MIEGYALLGLAVVLLDAIAIIGILLGHGAAAHKLRWTLVVVIFPVVGMIVYFVFGRSPRDA